MGDRHEVAALVDAHSLLPGLSLALVVCIITQMGAGTASLYHPPRCYRSVPLAQTCSPLIVVQMGEVRSTAPQKYMPHLYHKLDYNPETKAMISS